MQMTCSRLGVSVFLKELFSDIPGVLTELAGNISMVCLFFLHIELTTFRWSRVTSSVKPFAFQPHLVHLQPKRPDIDSPTVNEVSHLILVAMS